jgi:hypothetical protein
MQRVNFLSPLNNPEGGCSRLEFYNAFVVSNLSNTHEEGLYLVTSAD